MKHKLKILYYSETFNSSHGGKTHAREFFAAITDNKRVSKTILFSNRIPKYSSLSDTLFLGIKKYLVKAIVKYFKFIWFPFRILFPSKAKFKRLIKVINDNDINMVIIRHGNDFKYYQFLRNKFPQLEIIIEFNASPFIENSRDIIFLNYFKRLENRSLSVVNCISVVSEVIRDYIISEHDSMDNIFINPNGVDPQKFNVTHKKHEIIPIDMPEIPRGSIVFGYIGGMEKFRRLPEIVIEFIRLRGSGLKNLFLMIVGDGEDLEEILQIIEMNKVIAMNCIFCNKEWVQYDQIPRWLELFDVGIFPYSNPYGSPQKIFEYLAAGLPIIGPDVPALTNGTGREICNSLIKQDGSNLCSSIEKIYFNISDAKIIAQNCRKKYLMSYTWESNVNRLLDYSFNNNFK